MLLVWNLHLDRDEHVKAPFWPACPCCPHLSTFQHVSTWVKSFLSIGNQAWQLDIWNGKMMKIIELDGSSHGCRGFPAPFFCPKKYHPSPSPPTGRKAGTLLKSPRNGSGNTSWMWRYPGIFSKVPVRFLWDLSCRSGQFLFKNYDPETPRILHFYPFLVMIPIIRLQVLTTTSSPVHFTSSFHHSSNITQSFSSPARLSGANRYFVVSSYGEKSPLREACWTRPLLGESGCGVRDYTVILIKSYKHQGFSPCHIWPPWILEWVKHVISWLT